ncbi:MAG: non-canonical purine NTP pyrophosphatase [Candidatus Saccharimonadales bacterium]
MKAFTFVTSNQLKLAAAEAACKPYSISFDHSSVDFIEIQQYDGEVIARDKAEQAYKLIGQPVVITDDSWLIPGLGGFPGPYMRQINHWLTTDNLLDLTRKLTDRTIILRQVIVYQDSGGQQVFSSDIPGVLLDEARGDCPIMHFKLISFDDGQNSAAEIVEQGKPVIEHLPNGWHKLCQWLTTNNT